MADRGRRAFPISSPVIFEYDCENRYKIHRNRVRSARAVINTAPPEDFLHFHYNAKKCMQQAERLFDVERANRILLEKMTKYAEYNGAQHLRPWASRNTVNFKNGFVFRPGTGLHIDNLNIPVTNGTVAAGNRKTDYLRRKELEEQAKDNLRVAKKIAASKPVISAQKLQHEYLENVSRIDRLSTFRGPRSASHRSMRVREHLDAAKSMRTSQHLPGTAGYQRDLSRSIKHQRSQSARTSGRYGGTDEASDSHTSNATPTQRPEGRPPRSQSAYPRAPSIKIATGLYAYTAEASRSMKRVATFSRTGGLSRGNSRRASSARPSVAFSDTSEETPKRADKLKSGRPVSGRASPLLTPDASVTMVSNDGSREGPIAHLDRLAAPDLMSRSPEGSFDI